MLVNTRAKSSYLVIVNGPNKRQKKYNRMAFNPKEAAKMCVELFLDEVPEGLMTKGESIKTKVTVIPSTSDKKYIYTVTSHLTIVHGEFRKV